MLHPTQTDKEHCVEEPLEFFEFEDGTSRASIDDELSDYFFKGTSIEREGFIHDDGSLRFEFKIKKETDGLAKEETEKEQEKEKEQLCKSLQRELASMKKENTQLRKQNTQLRKKEPIKKNTKIAKKVISKPCPKSVKQAK